MKKYLLIVTLWMNIDGVASSLLSKLKELDYSEYEVDLILMNHTGPWMGEIPKEVTLLPPLHFNRRYKRVIDFLWYWIAGIYYRVFRRSHIDPIGGAQIRFELNSIFGWYPRSFSNRYYDECWIYGGNPALAKYVSAKVKKAWVHEDWGIWKIVPFLAKKQFKCVDYAVNVSTIAQEHFNALNVLSQTTQSIVIENELSVKWLKARTEEYQVEAFDGLKLLTVGRASAAKNFMRAIETAKILKDRGLLFKWIVVGDGECLGSLRTAVKQLDVGDVIEFVGGASNPCPYYKWCDLYICTSDTEAKSVTITEAQLLGKKVIMTNFPTARNHIKDEKYDIIVESSSEALAARIESIYREM